MPDRSPRLDRPVEPDPVTSAVNAISRSLPTSLSAATGRQRRPLPLHPQLDLQPAANTPLAHASSSDHLIAAAHSLPSPMPHPATATPKPPETTEQSP